MSEPGDHYYLDLIADLAVEIVQQRSEVERLRGERDAAEHEVKRLRAERDDAQEAAAGLDQWAAVEAIRRARGHDREPQPSDGPDYHADHQAWVDRAARDHKEPGTEPEQRLCPRSFASHPENHVDPTDVEGWGICRTCGETVNIQKDRIPEHRAARELEP